MGLPLEMSVTEYPESLGPSTKGKGDCMGPSTNTVGGKDGLVADIWYPPSITTSPGAQLGWGSRTTDWTWSCSEISQDTI